MPHRFVCALIASIIACTINPVLSAAQDEALWQNRIQYRNETAERQKAGEVLEAAFNRAFSSCGLGNFVQRRPLRSDRRLTRIPQVLQANIQLDDSVRMLRSTSLARALSYIAPAGSDPVLVQVPEESRHVRVDPRTSPSLMIAEGDPRLVYTNSCGTVVDAAARLGINVNPVARAAFDAMRRMQTDVSIAVTEGPFISPIASLLDNPGTGGFYGRLLIWDWYSRNLGALTTGGSYRSYVNGIVISRLFTDELEQSLKASAEGNSGPLAFVSLNANAKASIIQNQGSRAERYGIWEYVRPRNAADVNAYLKALPTATVVAQEMVNRMDADLIRNNDDLVQSLPYRHSFRVDGFHPDYCTAAQGQWRIGGPHANSLSMTARREPAGDNVPWIRCVFEVTFNPSESVFQEPHPQDFTLAYTLINTIGNGANAYQLALPFEVPLHLVDNPVLTLTRPAGHWSAITPNEASSQGVTWTGYEVLVADSRNRVDWVNFNPGEFRAQLTCPRISDASITEDIPLALLGAPRRDANTGIVTFEMRAAFPAGATPNAATARQCTLSGTTEFVLQNGVRVRKRLPKTPISYPGA
jgi:hypothetical protein